MRPVIPVVAVALLLVGAAVLHVSPGITGGLTGTAQDCADCNVVVLQVDMLRPDHMGIHGYDRNTTPTIDRIAAESYVFNRTFSQSAYTTPAMFSLLSGRYPSQHGVTPETLDAGTYREDVRTFPAAFQDAGYRTVGVYDHFGPDGSSPPFERGFDTVLRWQDGPGLARDIDRALDGAEPFLLHVQTSSIHEPYVPPDHLRGTFTPDGVDAATLERYRAFQDLYAAGETPGQDSAWAGCDPLIDCFYQELADDPVFRRLAIASYDARVRHVDRQVGEILDVLADRGAMDDTVVVVTAAHGEAFDENLPADPTAVDARQYWGHATLHNEIINVPLIIRVPGTAGGSIDRYTSSIDIAPTLLDLVGIRDDAYLSRSHGVSLRPLLGNGTIDEPYILAEHDNGETVLIDVARRLKSFHDVEYAVRPRAVYDLERDWAEERPLGDPALRDRMEDRLRAFHRSLPGRNRSVVEGTWPYFN